MQKHNDTIDIRFFARASENIQIRLYETPILEYPYVHVSNHLIFILYTYLNFQLSNFIK